MDVAAGLKLSLGGFAKIEGPFVASIGYGAKVSKKAESELNLYGLKLENISIAEVKQSVAEMKNTPIKLTNDGVKLVTGALTLQTIGTKMITSGLHINL